MMHYVYSFVCSTSTKLTPGDFSSLFDEDTDFDRYKNKTLRDDFNNINALGFEAWDYLKNAKNAHSLFLMNNEDSPEIYKKIENAMYAYHSGASYRFSLSIMILIAKMGWDEYVKYIRNIQRL